MPLFITRRTAGHDKITSLINCRNDVACRQRDDLIDPAGSEPTSSARFGRGRERGIDVAFGTRAQNTQLLSGGTSGLKTSRLPLKNLLESVDPGRVATRPIEANDQARCDRIDAACEDNWNRCGCRVGGVCRGAASVATITVTLRSTRSPARVKVEPPTIRGPRRILVK